MCNTTIYLDEQGLFEVESRFKVTRCAFWPFRPFRGWRRWALKGNSRYCSSISEPAARGRARKTTQEPRYVASGVSIANSLSRGLTSPFPKRSCLLLATETVGINFHRYCGGHPDLETRRVQYDSEERTGEDYKTQCVAERVKNTTENMRLYHASRGAAWLMPATPQAGEKRDKAREECFSILKFPCPILYPILICINNPHRLIRGSPDVRAEGVVCCKRSKVP